jgi:hypothetical protein
MEYLKTIPFQITTNYTLTAGQELGLGHRSDNSGLQTLSFSLERVKVFNEISEVSVIISVDNIPCF